MDAGTRRSGRLALNISGASIENSVLPIPTPTLRNAPTGSSRSAAHWHTSSIAACTGRRGMVQVSPRWKRTVHLATRLAALVRKSCLGRAVRRSPSVWMPCSARASLARARARSTACSGVMLGLYSLCGYRTSSIGGPPYRSALTIATWGASWMNSASTPAAHGWKLSITSWEGKPPGPLRLRYCCTLPATYRGPSLKPMRP